MPHLQRSWVFVGTGPTAEGLEMRRLLSSPAEVAWSTYVGGTSQDQGEAIARDRDGNLFVTGSETNDNAYPHKGYVAKISRSGAILWTEYIDEYSEGIRAIACDSSGDLWVTGPGGSVSKLSTSGNVLWTLHLGGSGREEGYGIAIGPDGSAVVVGETYSRDFVGALNQSPGTASCGYAAKVSSSGSLNWARYIGGSGNRGHDGDVAEGVAAENNGNVLVVGSTRSTDLQKANNTYHGGSNDGFVTELNPAGELLWSTYLGGSGDDGIGAVALDRAGGILLTGSTSSVGFAGINDGSRGVDAFAAKLSRSGDLAWVTSIGGSDWDYATGIVADDSDNVIIGGMTDSANFAEATNSYHGNTDGFVSEISGAGELLWSVYIGGSAHDTVKDLAYDGSNSLFIVGCTDSRDIGAATNAYHGGIPGDALVACLTLLQTHVQGTLGGDTIHLSAATVTDPVSGASAQGIQVTVNGVSGQPFVPAGKLVIDGQAGNDRITVDPDVSFPILIYGGAGNDTIFGGGGNDTIYGNTGDDQITTGEGSNSVLAGLGNDTLSGGSSADTLLGGNGTDLIYGQGGNDYLEGKGKAETLYGGSGNDTILGGAGSDLIYGNAGDDWIDTGRSPAFLDTIHGGQGSDTALADPNDLLDSVETPILT